jgi:predicted nucleic acid-binding protein
VKAADTSLVVTAFASWHDKHDGARRALDDGLRLRALRAPNVLRSHPPAAAPSRSRGARARLPDGALPRAVVATEPESVSPAREVSGGAAYDALVAAVAAEHGCELVTCDRRAAPIYERYAIRVSML